MAWSWLTSIVVPGTYLLWALFGKNPRNTRCMQGVSRADPVASSQEEGCHLKLAGHGPKTTGSLVPLQQMALLTTYMEMLFFWSPFIPLLSGSALHLSKASFLVLPPPEVFQMIDTRFPKIFKQAFGVFCNTLLLSQKHQTTKPNPSSSSRSTPSILSLKTTACSTVAGPFWPFWPDPPGGHGDPGLGILSAAAANLFLVDTAVWHFQVRLPSDAVSRQAALSRHAEGLVFFFFLGVGRGFWKAFFWCVSVLG